MFLDSFGVLSHGWSISKISLIIENTLVARGNKGNIRLPNCCFWCSLKLRPKNWLYRNIFGNLWNLTILIGHYQGHFMRTCFIKQYGNSLFVILFWNIFYHIRTRKLPFISEIVKSICRINITGCFCIECKFRRIKPGICWCNRKLRNRCSRFYIHIDCIDIFLSNFILDGKFNGIITRLFKLFFNFFSL